ncbi:hypothetical protein F4778DRAFT_727536 [Xylariomycetidae sp. FL2044]|nr:hypothetical protein F4778DRAFT_727536 [Xylariomycetidae sp. FL2044]
MAVQGFGAGDFAAIAKFAWTTYGNIRESRSNFGNLNIDVECLLVSIGSLDKGHTQHLIQDYIRGAGDGDEARELEVRALRDGLNSVVMPFYALFETNTSAFKPPKDGSKSLRPLPKGGVAMYVHGPSTTQGPSRSPTPREKPWRYWQEAGWIKRLKIAFDLQDMTELRSRFAVQAANLNLFMTRLTHTQLQRQTELLTLNMAEQSLLGHRNGFPYGRDLAEASVAFRRDVAAYVRFLLDGGAPLSDAELRRRNPEIKELAMLKTEKEHKVAEYSAPNNHHSHITPTSLVGGSRDYDDDTAMLDDDATFKLAAARKRLAASDLEYEPIDTGLVSVDQGGEAPAKKSPSSSQGGASGKAPVSSGDGRRPPRATMIEIICDTCDRTIRSETSFYRCDSGKCGKSGNYFDVCRRCWSDGSRCPGFDRGRCPEMKKVVLRNGTVERKST